MNIKEIIDNELNLKNKGLLNFKRICINTKTQLNSIEKNK